MKKFYTLLTLCVLSIAVMAEKQISGIVVDEKSEPVIGASIQVDGTTMGTISDFDGEFELSVPDDATTITVSYIGMKEQKLKIQKVMRIVLEEAAHELQDVVITGYGNVSKGSFAGSAQAVNAENIEKKNPTEITKALAGEVAGVQVVNTDGQPGSTASIRIRGLGSINASSGALYVVDGIPFDGDIAAIDPSDIASTTILKDATATSLYGARGANGVVLITTKKGNSGEEGKIDVDVKYGANMRLLPMYDAISSPEDYLILCWQGLYNTKKDANYASRNLFSTIAIPEQYNIWNMKGNLLINPYASDGSIQPTIADGVQRKPGYEKLESWKDAIFRVGQKAEATVKIHGGTEKLNYYTSFGYLKDEGYYYASDFQRINVRSNLDYQPKKWLKASLNMSYSYTQINNPGQDDEAANNGFLFINTIPALYPVYQRNPDGSIMEDPHNPGQNAYDYGMYEGYGRPYSPGINPAGALRLDKQRTTRHQVVTSAMFEFKLYDGLKLTLNVGEQYLGSKGDALDNKYYGDAAGIGYVTNTNYNYLSLTANQLLEYNNIFGDHTVRVMAGHETNYYTVNYIYGHKAGLVQPDGLALSNGVSMRGTEGNFASQALESYLATASYSYDERYMVTANYRADGSSKFAKGHRWGHFGSVGVAWNLTNESFMESVETLKNTKLRLSWGVLGNQEIGDYNYTDLYVTENINDSPGYVWSSRGNNDLTWERSQIVDLGLEFEINKYLDAEIDYFYKLTDNMLFARYVAPSLGYGGYPVNDAKMVNQGLEFQFNVHAVDMRNVKLDIRLNGAHYRNMMTQMPLDGDERMVMSGGMSVGHSIYDWYLPEYAGVNPETGLARYWVYYDADKGTFAPREFGFEEATNVTSGPNFINSLHEYQLKNPDAHIERVAVEGNESTYATSTYSGKSGIPALAGGFGIDLEAYGVTFSVACSYGLGGYGYDNTYALLMNSDRAGQYNWHTDMKDSWTPTNDQSNKPIDKQIPRLSNYTDKYANMASTRFLTSNTYLSLNNISLGYKFPKKLIEKIKLETLHLWVSADNLAIASARKGYNPTASFDGTSSSSQYTPLSTVMGGIRFTF